MKLSLSLWRWLSLVALLISTAGFVSISPQAAQASGPCPANTASVTYVFNAPNCVATFSYTGAVQTFTVPAGVTSIAFVVTAGSGGNAGPGTGGTNAGGSGTTGGTGGSVTGTLTVTPSSSLNLYVGGAGSITGLVTPTTRFSGGFNGGGSALTYACNTSSRSGTGGGASDIRVGGTALANRVVVAGGGGGAGFTNCVGNANYFDKGGAGGSGASGQGSNGFGTDTTYVAGYGYGATQSAAGSVNSGAPYYYSTNCAGSLGIGGSTAMPSTAGWCGQGGGGGGGYYGGAAGPAGGGGGGSSWYNSSLVTVSGNPYSSTNVGNGVITLTYLAAPSVSTFTVTPNSPSNANLFTYTVNFTSAVTGFDMADVSLTGASGTSGTWTKTLVSGSGAGPYVFTVSNSSPIDGDLSVNIDQSGVLDAFSTAGSGLATNTLTIDRTAPAAPTGVTASPGALTATSTNVTFTANIAASSATGGSAEFYLNGVLLGTDASIAAGDTTVSWSPATATNAALKAVIASGGSITVVLKDAAGNSSSSTALALAVDYRQAQTISGLVVSNQTFSSTAISLNLTATSGLAVALSSSTPSVCSATGLQITMLASGTCIVSADQAGNSNFLPAPTVTQSFTITRATQSISLTPATSLQLAVGATQTLAASGALGSGAITYQVTTGNSVCSLSGAVLTAVSAGVCTVTASIAQDASYNTATSGTLTVTVKVGQLITFAAPTDIALAAGSRSITFSTDAAGLTVTVTSSTASVCTVVGSSVTLVSAGTCTLVASQAGNATYLAATSVTRSFQVAANPSAAVINSISVSGSVPGGSALVTFTPGNANGSTVTGYTITATPNGGGSSVTITCQASPCTVSGLSAGVVYSTSVTTNAVVAGQNATVVSTSSSSPTILSLNQISITAPSAVNPANGAFSVSAISSADPTWAVTLVSQTPAICSISGALVTPIAEGLCIINASNSGGLSASANYAAGSSTIQINIVNPPSTPIIPTIPKPISAPVLNVPPGLPGAVSKLEVLSTRSQGGKQVVVVDLAAPAKWNLQLILNVKDSSGSVVSSKQISVAAGTLQIEIDGNNLPEGHFYSAFTLNEFGKSAEGPVGSNLRQAKTFTRVDSNGLPVLQGKSLGAPVFFDADSSSISTKQREALRQVAQHAKQNLGRVLVTGFVKSSGLGVRAEKKLATARALSVAKYLSSQGVNVWIDYAGFGALSSANSKSTDRRVEIRWVAEAVARG